MTDQTTTVPEHVLPETSSDERMHDLDENCGCGIWRPPRAA